MNKSVQSKSKSPQVAKGWRFITCRDNWVNYFKSRDNTKFKTINYFLDEYLIPDTAHSNEKKNHLNSFAPSTVRAVGFVLDMGTQLNRTLWAKMNLTECSGSNESWQELPCFKTYRICDTCVSAAIYNVMRDLRSFLSLQSKP